MTDFAMIKELFHITKRNGFSHGEIQIIKNNFGELTVLKNNDSFDLIYASSDREHFDEMDRVLSKLAVEK
ncbi:hypothetical protein AB4Z45_32725 [Paenibacillus sp. MCAF9]|uniref:hypothetical protein n=1 Tax=Paenibacillus sp. MCAF9 TaxID=3233046 RepID=UPI003F99F12B